MGLRSNLQKIQNEHVRSTQTFEETCARIMDRLDRYAVNRTRFLIARDAEAQIKKGNGGSAVEGEVYPLYLLDHFGVYDKTASCQNAPLRSKVLLLQYASDASFYKFNPNTEMVFVPENHGLRLDAFERYLKEHPTYRHPGESDSLHPTIFPGELHSLTSYDDVLRFYKTQPYFFLTVPKLSWETTLQPTDLGRQFLESLGKFSREEGIDLDARLWVRKNHLALVGSKEVSRAASASIPLSGNPPTSYSLQPERDFAFFENEGSYAIAARIAVHYRIPL